MKVVILNLFICCIIISCSYLERDQNKIKSTVHLVSGDSYNLWNVSFYYNTLDHLDYNIDTSHQYIQYNYTAYINGKAFYQGLLDEVWPERICQVAMNRQILYELREDSRKQDSAIYRLYQIEKNLKYRQISKFTAEKFIINYHLNNPFIFIGSKAIIPCMSNPFLLPLDFIERADLDVVMIVDTCIQPFVTPSYISLAKPLRIRSGFVNTNLLESSILGRDSTFYVSPSAFDSVYQFDANSSVVSVIKMDVDGLFNIYPYLTQVRSQQTNESLEFCGRYTYLESSITGDTLIRHFTTGKRKEKNGQIVNRHGMIFCDLRNKSLTGLLLPDSLVTQRYLSADPEKKSFRIHSKYDSTSRRYGILTLASAMHASGPSEGLLDGLTILSPQGPNIDKLLSLARVTDCRQVIYLPQLACQSCLKDQETIVARYLKNQPSLHVFVYDKRQGLRLRVLAGSDSARIHHGDPSLYDHHLTRKYVNPAVFINKKGQWRQVTPPSAGPYDFVKAFDEATARLP